MNSAMVNLYAVAGPTGQLKTEIVVLSNLHGFISRFSACKFYPLSVERFKEDYQKMYEEMKEKVAIVTGAGSGIRPCNCCCIR